MTAPTPSQLPARIRAAIAYSGHTNTQVAKALNISVSTLERWRGGSSVGAAPSEEQLLALARYCNVPYGFITDGFPRANRDNGRPSGSTAEQISRLDRLLKLAAADRDLLAQELEALHETLETRYGELANQMLQLTRRLDREDDPPCPSHPSAA